LRPDLIHEVSKITDAMWPGAITVPMMVMGATDGAYLRRAGIPTYGVQGLFMDRNDFRAHGRDERMGVHAFYEGEAFLYELVKALSQ
jgi:acetylornithine deacetylase/succinyl-diaminopimelate desuccinylase-like protein